VTVDGLPDSIIGELLTDQLATTERSNAPWQRSASVEPKPASFPCLSSVLTRSFLSVPAWYPRAQRPPRTRLVRPEHGGRSFATRVRPSLGETRTPTSVLDGLLGFPQLGRTRTADDHRSVLVVLPNGIARRSPKPTRARPASSCSPSHIHHRRAAAPPVPTRAL
jgi:hypothetical protein